MTSRLGGLSANLARIAAVVMIGAAVSACSSVPDWVDPTTWVGGSSDDSASADNSLPADQQVDEDGTATASASSDEQGDDQTASSDQSPNLAYIPDRPAPSSTPEEQQDVAQSLSADRSRAHYSSEQLRGDKSSPAPVYASNTSDNAANTAAATQTAAPTRQVVEQQVASTSTAPVATTRSAGPAVPANSLGVAAAAHAPANTDAALGFQPSKAPPLDASVAQFVPQPILERYQQTASISAPTVTAAPAAPAATDSEASVGGPEAMSGAVVANLDAIQPGAPAADSVTTNTAGLPASAVIFFPHDTTILSAQARGQVRQAAEAYRTKGSTGFVRVVGHSSSRTANMTLARHLAYNFDRSQARATAVAKELIRDGVPADKVLVEAVGDSQPVYYESMPQGEEGNRRAEIFLPS